MANDPVAGQSDGQGTGALGAGSTEAASSAPSSQPWFDGLPEGLKADPSLQAFKGKEVSAVVESYINAQKLVGGSIRVPGKDAKPEDVKAFRDKVAEAIGRPASPDKYSVKAPAAAELGIAWDDKRQAAVLQAAHKLGLSNEGAADLALFVADQLKAEQPNMAEDFRACMETLEKGDPATGLQPWGSSTPRFLGVAKRVVDTMFPAGTMEKLDASGLSNDPNFLHGLYRMGKEMIEDGIISGEEVNTATGDVEGAQKRLDKIMADQSHPYWQPAHPEHDKAIEEALSLRRFIFG